MCTVVCRFEAGDAIRILALRDEFVSRAFDEPDAWWPDQPTVIGGRDHVAGGSWCVSDVASGRTALVVNRVERFEGAPSRGRLPLAAVADGDGWTSTIDHRAMASFNLVLAGPDGVVVWLWDATALQRLDLAPGTHMITSRGVDADDAKTVRFAPLFEQRPWLDVVTSCSPSVEDSALVVRRELPERTYATVFGQSITSAPGSLRVAHSRTPWQDGTWVDQTWPQMIAG
ncbi:MAG: NRDE family protein [Jatrophihabitans sp.]